MPLTFGVGFPSCREGTAYPPGFVRPKELAPLAQLVERLGYHSLWSNDHLTTPRVMRGYLEGRPSFYEPIVTYAALANVTERLRLAFSVIVLPNRDPVLLAKQIATLDQLTDGRVQLAVGIGSDRDEFEAVRPDLKGAHRGVLLDERIQALRRLFSEPAVTSWMHPTSPGARSAKGRWSRASSTWSTSTGGATPTRASSRGVR